LPGEDKTRIYALVGGVVRAVRVTNVTGNEATVEIIIGLDATAEPAFTFVTASEPAPTIPAQAQPAEIVRVVDGDTVVVNLAGGEQPVRLIGVDTPETKHPTQPVGCYGPEAAEFTQTQLPPGTIVYLETDAEATDHYGRLLAYVWTADGEMVNRRLVQAGYAQPLAIAPNTRYAAEFKRLAEEARLAGVGLWGACP
jgi:micrococcal nuclease